MIVLCNISQIQSDSGNILNITRIIDRSF